jgi:hypothetical protein
MRQQGRALRGVATAAGQAQDQLLLPLDAAARHQLEDAG